MTDETPSSSPRASEDCELPYLPPELCRLIISKTDVKICLAFRDFTAANTFLLTENERSAALGEAVRDGDLEVLGLLLQKMEVPASDNACALWEAFNGYGGRRKLAWAFELFWPFVNHTQRDIALESAVRWKHFDAMDWLSREWQSYDPGIHWRLLQTIVGTAHFGSCILEPELVQWALANKGRLRYTDEVLESLVYFGASASRLPLLETIASCEPRYMITGSVASAAISYGRLEVLERLLKNHSAAFTGNEKRLYRWAAKADRPEAPQWLRAKFPHWTWPA